MTSNDEAARNAAQAAEIAANLKKGSWESVQALATLSIAQSLLARDMER